MDPQRGLAARLHFVLRTTFGIRIRKVFPITGPRDRLDFVLLLLLILTSSLSRQTQGLCYIHIPQRFANSHFRIATRNSSDRRSRIPRRISSLSTESTHPRLTRKPPQHSCRGLLPAAQDVKRGARNVTSKDPSVAAASLLASSASTPCSCSGVDGHSRDRDSGLAWIQGTCRDWV